MYICENIHFLSESPFCQYWLLCGCCLLRLVKCQLSYWSHITTSDLWTQTHTVKLINDGKSHQSLVLITYSGLCQSSFPFCLSLMTSIIYDFSVSLCLSQLRYQKCLVARPPSQKACGSSPPGDSVSRRVSTSVKKGVLSLIDTLKQKRPVTELPQ